MCERGVCLARGSATVRSPVLGFPAEEAGKKAAVMITALHLAAAVPQKHQTLSSKLTGAIALPLPVTSSLDGESWHIILRTGTSGAAEAPISWLLLLVHCGNCSDVVQYGPQAPSEIWTKNT